MPAPYISVPYEVLGQSIGIARAERFNLELIFSAGNLDSLTSSSLDDLRKTLDYSPSLTFHAPYMDLSPGGVDVRVRDVTRDRFMRMFDVASAVHPRAMVFHTGYEKWRFGLKPDIWLDGSTRMWEEFIPIAKEMDIKIALENVFEDDPFNIRDLMERLNSEQVGVCFDCGHFNLFAKDPLSVWTAALGGHIIELHLHDNLGDRDAHLAMGDGSFDFDGLFRALEGRGVILTVESHTAEHVYKSLSVLNTRYQRFLI